MAKYDWAVNKLKLDRAIKEASDKVRVENEVLKAQNKPQTAELKESSVKEIYVRLNGLLVDDAPVIEVKEENGVKRVNVKRKKK